MPTTIPHCAGPAHRQAAAKGGSFPRREPPLIITIGAGFPLLVLVVGPLDGKPAVAPRHFNRTDIEGMAWSNAEVVETHDLAKLTPDAAASLDRKQGRFRVVTDGPRDRQRLYDVYEALPRDEPEGVMYLRYQKSKSRDAEGELTVEATLRVIHHPVHLVGPVRVAPFVEHWMVDAVRVP